MAELVRVAHDAHGLDPAVDDIHREDAAYVDGGLLVASVVTRSTAGVSAALHKLRELLGLDRAGRPQSQPPLGLQPLSRTPRRRRLLAREPLARPGRPVGGASQGASGLAVDPHPPVVELAGSRGPLSDGG